jgi:hypothetical protein
VAHKAGLDVMNCRVGFVVDKATLGQVLSEYFGLPCQSLHQFLQYHNYPGHGTIGLLVAVVPNGPNWTPPSTIQIKKNMNCRYGQEIFPFSITSRQVLGPTLPFIEWVPRVVN